MPFMVSELPEKKFSSQKFSVRFYEWLPQESTKNEENRPKLLNMDEPEGSEAPPAPVKTETTPVRIKRSSMAKKTSPSFSDPFPQNPGEKNSLEKNTASDSLPEALLLEAPQYPAFARRRGIEGRVVVRFRVAPDGSPRDISILEAEPSDIFDESVLKAVKSWEFKAAHEEWVIVPVHFSLTASP